MEVVYGLHRLVLEFLLHYLYIFSVFIQFILLRFLFEDYLILYLLT